MILVFSLFIISLFLLGCSKNNDIKNSLNTINNEKGSSAQDFEVQLVDGSIFRLSDYKDKKPVIIEFWATWCPFCKQDFNTVKNIYPKYKDDVEFIAIDLDSGEDAETIKDYIKKNGLDDIKFAAGKTKILSDYSVTSTTTKYAIGRDGKILWKGSGAIDSDSWELIFKGLKDS